MSAELPRALSSSSSSGNSIVYRGMTQEELDAAYNNSDAVSNSLLIKISWVAHSLLFRPFCCDHPDIPYGPLLRNKVDIYHCGRPDAPTVAFCHGGYWHFGSRDVVEWYRKGPLAHKINFVAIGYTLAPDATLTQIVAEVQSAIRWIREEGPRYGIGGTKVIVSGNSAGGHLAAMTLGMEGVDGALLISGLYELKPIKQSFLNKQVNLTDEEADLNSPLLHIPEQSAPCIIAYGTEELPELVRQSVAFDDALRKAGRPSELLPITGHNHFSIMEEMISPDGILTDALVRLVTPASS